MERIISIRNVIIYIIFINLFTFFMMFLDKQKAKKNKMRIAEKTLFILALLGGAIGGIAGMYAFRHKTKKTRFVIGFPMILIFECMCLIAIFILYVN